MLTGDYKIADIKMDAKITNRFTEFENEMAKEIGGDVVLIAYQRDEKVKD